MSVSVRAGPASAAPLCVVAQMLLCALKWCVCVLRPCGGRHRERRDAHFRHDGRDRALLVPACAARLPRHVPAARGQEYLGRGARMPQARIHPDALDARIAELVGGRGHERAQRGSRELRSAWGCAARRRRQWRALVDSASSCSRDASRGACARDTRAPSTSSRVSADVDVVM